MPKTAPLTDGLMAAVDLGSNSFHLATARLQHGVIRITESQSEKVQLAAGLDADNHLSPAAMDRGLACLARFAQKLEGVEPRKLRIVATNALRVARNAKTFVKAAEQVLKHPIEIIAGREEARLIYVGVSHSLGAEGRRLVMDIGGGSTECIIGEGHDALHTESLHMGCVSYTQRFFSSGRIDEKLLNRAFAAARLELAPISRRYRQVGWQSATGSSGTIKAVRNVIQQLGWGEPDGSFSAADVERLRGHLLRYGQVSEVELPGLKEDRRPLMPAGIALVHALFESFKLERMNYSDGALREGVLYDLLDRTVDAGDVRNRTVLAMQKRLSLDEDFADRCADTAAMLLAQVAGPLALDDDQAALLERAVRLHEVGLTISHSGYHKHGAYLLQHADLPGFGRPEQEALALLVGSHRRRLRSEQHDALLAAGGVRLLQLALLLRLAVLLNYSRSREPLPKIRLQLQDQALKLRFPSGWLATHPLTQADLEQEQAYLSAIGVSLDYA